MVSPSKAKPVKKVTPQQKSKVERKDVSPSKAKPTKKIASQHKVKVEKKVVSPSKAKPVKKLTSQQKPKTGKMVVSPSKSAPARKKITTEKPKAKKAAQPIQTKKSKIETKAEKKIMAPKKVIKEKIKAPKEKAESITPLQAETPVNKIPVKPSVRYSETDLKMFAKVITEARREALDELRMLKEKLEDLTNYDFAEESMIYSMHMAEQGSEAMEKEKTYAQIQRISEHIKKLDDAMQRIKDKTYGICRVCGCLIARERLLAVPITTLSASYKIHQKCPENGIDRIEPIK